MPSSVFPRPSAITAETVTALSVPGPMVQRTRSGRIQTRGSTMRGRMWAESYNPMLIGSAEAEGWLAWVRWAWNTGITFTVKHLTTPGSGVTPNGLGTGGITVYGTQTGATMGTEGWPNNTSNVVRAGDLLNVVGLDYVVQAVDDADSDGSGRTTFTINPPTFTGGSAAHGGAVTTTDVVINAKIIDQPNFPPVGNAFWYEGFSIIFNEAP